MRFTIVVAFFVAGCGGSAPAPAPVISSFTATPAEVSHGGGSVTLAWAVSNATRLEIDRGVGDVTGKTSTTVPVSAATTFTLTASNGGTSVSASAAVTVAAQAPWPPSAGDDLLVVNGATFHLTAGTTNAYHNCTVQAGGRLI